MKNLVRSRLTTVVLLLGLVSLLLTWWAPSRLAAAGESSPRQQLARIWKEAGDIGRYHYRTTVLQTQHPTLSLANVGRTARTDRLVIQGEMDAFAESMTMQMVMANQPPLQIKYENGRGYGRVNVDDPWTETQVTSDLFAPGGDPMAFLTAAENVRVENGDGTGDPLFPGDLLPAAYAESITRYQFDLSGLKVAQLMRAQMEDYLRSQGHLPTGVSLQMAQKYVDMTGVGEIWVSSRGLPVRQIMTLQFPAQAGAAEWVSAEVTTDFSAWAPIEPPQLAFDWRQPGAAVSTLLAAAGIRPEAAREMGFILSSLLLVMAAILLVATYRRNQAFQLALNVTIIVSMLAVPLLQAERVYAFGQYRQSVAPAQVADKSSQAAVDHTTTSPSTVPSSAPLASRPAPVLALTSTCVITATSDCDGDGLTDNEEIYELGTRIDQIDTDGDGISDKTEVTPFMVNGQTWYLDPLKLDSNGDGLGDGAECFGRSDVITTTLLTPLWNTCDDADSDGVPNVYDFDDDGDGVPDGVDLAPLDSQTVVSQTFSLEIAGAASDTNLFVDIQVRPLDERHLWWTNSALNWPDGDDQGQIMRVTTDTLTADGDMVLIPMLEITIPYSETNPAGGLPISGTHTITATSRLTDWLDTPLLDKYKINVTLSENGDRIVYVPLVQATDPNGDSPVAWQTRMPYRLAADAGGWGAPHQIKVVWLVSGQRDTCTPPAGKSYTAYCKDHANWVSTTRLLQTYYDDFAVTGMHVTEHHGAEALMAAQTTNTGFYEPELWHLADTMQQVYLNSQEVTASQRFALGDVSTTASQWGLGGKLAFNHITGLVDDTALLEAVSGDAVPAFLRTNIYTSDPVSGTVASVLLLSEGSTRTRTMGEVEVTDGDPPIATDRFTISDNTFHVDLTSAELQSVGAMRLQTYRFSTGTGWTNVAPSALLTDLMAALDSTLTEGVMANLLGGDDVTDLVKARDGAILMAVNYYLAMYVPSAQVLAVDGVSETGIPLVNGEHVRPTEPVAAIVQRLATNLKEYFSLIDLSALNVPTVDANKSAGTADAWAGLAASRGTILEGFGDVLQGNSASAATLALVEIANYPTTISNSDLLDLSVFAILDTIISDFVAGVVVPSLTGHAADSSTSTSDFGQASGSSLVSAGSSIPYTGLSAYKANVYDHKIIRALRKTERTYIGGGNHKFLSVYEATKVLYVEALSAYREWQNFPSPETLARSKQINTWHHKSLEKYQSIVSNTAKAWAFSGVVSQIGTSGLIITLALARGAVQADSPAFSQLLAEQIGAIIVETFIAILSFVIFRLPVFPISYFLTALTIIDGVMVAACAAFNLGTDANFNRWFCGGISGALATAFSYVINDTTPLVDLKRSDRLDVVLDTPAFGNESGLDGVIVGNSVTLSGTVTNTLYMDDPNWLGYVWWWQWSDNNLDDATFAYRMQASAQDIPLDLNGTAWTPVPGKKSSSISANDARFNHSFAVQPLVNTFSAPGINQGLPAYFSEGYAVKKQNCWLTVVGLLITCWLNEFDGTNHTDMEDRFIFDVLPASLDEFRTLVLADDGKGYRMAWDARFPTLADADGDGLRSLAVGGNDPNDNSPDMDADGLSDYFEMSSAGFDETQADGDCDGLTDYWELFYGTDPARADSDGDGLLDGEELFHPNRLNPYENSVLSNSNPPVCATSAAAYTGGWPIVYGYDSGGAPLSTWVSADPRDPDSDDDTLSDKQERIYAYNPNVASRLNVLSLDSTIETSSGQMPYVAPTGVVTYTAVVTNELTLPFARGLLETELPLDTVRRTQSLGIIAPQTAVTLTGSIGMAETGISSSGPVPMGVRAGAILDDPTGRSLWLHMNEPVGSTTFADSSFLGNDGSCSGATCPTANGSSLTFDGGDGLLVPDSGELDLDQFTIAVAVKPTATYPAAHMNLVAKWDSASSTRANYLLALYPGTNRAVFLTSTCAIDGGDSLVSPSGLPLNQWSHITATFDGSTKKLFVNGALVASTTVSGAVCQNDSPVSIGNKVFGYEPFIGQMDEVEIYPQVLEPAVVLSRYGAPSLQVDMRNSTTWGSDDVTCSGNRCPSAGGDGASFAQTNFLSAAAPDLSGDAFSFAMWIKPQSRSAPMNAEVAAAYGKDADRDWQGVFGNMVYDSGQATWPQASTIYPSLFVSSDGALRMMMGDGSASCQITTNGTNLIQRDVWQFVVVSYDGSNFTFYVNGQAISGGTTGPSCAGVTPPSVSTLNIGRPNDYGYGWVDRLNMDHLADDEGYPVMTLRVNLNEEGASGNIWGTTANSTGIINLKKAFRVSDTSPNQWFRLYQNNRKDNNAFESAAAFGGVTDTSLVQVTGINNFNNLGIRPHSFLNRIAASTAKAEGTLYFGVFNDYFQGSLDDFQVYQLALGPDRVAEMYNASLMTLDLPFDEAPGATLFADASGNFASVACSGASCPVSGVPGRRNQALAFDGVDDYLILGSSTDELGFTSGDFSVMMWIKPEDFLGTGGFGQVPLMEIGAYNYVGLSNGRMTVQGAVLAQAKDSLYNATGRWYHLAYVYDKAKARYTLYLNGKSIWQQTYGVPNQAASLQIGRWTTVGGSHYYYNGMMDDLTVVKRSLTQAEVQAHFDRAPAVNLHLDEDLRRTVFTDESNNRYAATCAPATACPDAGDKGQMREAVTFDGDDTLTLAATSSLTLTNFSVGMWVKPTKSVNGAQRLITKSNANVLDANFRLWLLPNTMTVRFDRQYACADSEANWHTVDAANPLLEDQWNYVMATHNAASGVMALYVNGALAGSTTGIGNTICTATNPIQLGQAFNGGMDEVSVYKTVVNAAQVADIYTYQSAWFDVIDQHALYVDADLPTVDLSWTPATLSTAETVLALSVADASSLVSKVEVRIDGSGTWQSAYPSSGDSTTSRAWLYYFVAGAGTHTIEARATDVVGNVSAIASVNVRVDDGAPSLTLDTSTTVLSVTNSTVISGTVSDLYSGVPNSDIQVVALDHTGAPVTGILAPTLGQGDSWQATQPFLETPYGIYTATVQAADGVGNRASASASLKLDGLPPYADVTDGKNYISPLATKTIAGVASDVPYPVKGRTLHLHFESGSGLWEDGSQTGFTMQCSGSTCPTSGVAGVQGSAVTFDGGDDLLTFTGTEALTQTTTAQQLGLADSSFTVMAWVKSADWSGGRALLGSSPTVASDGLFLGVQDGSPILGYGGDDTVMTGTIPTDEWVHLAWRFDAEGGELAFFVNGALGAEITDGHIPFSAEDAIQLGRARGGNAFASSVDELVVYAQAVPDEIIYDIANPLTVGVSSLALRVRSYAQRDFGQYEGTWTPISLNTADSLFTTWQATLPTLATGAYKIDLQVTDSLGNSQFVEGAWDFAIVAPDMAVSKQSAIALAGLSETVGFTIHYTNTGVVTATNVVLTETVPVDASFDDALSHPDWACTPDGSAGNVCTLAVGDMAVGASGTVSFTVTVANAWSAGTKAIVNTVVVGADGGDSVPENNSATAQVPVDAEIDLAVTMVDDGTDFQYTTEGSSAVIYTMSYTNTGSQPALPKLTVDWSQGGDRDPFDPDVDWVCIVNPYTLEGYNTCTQDLGTLGVGQSGSVTFTLYTGYFLPDSLLITTTVTISDTAGANELNIDDNTDVVSTPIQVDYSVVLDVPSISVPEGSVATNGGLLLTPPYDPEFPPLFALYPAPSAGQMVNRDDVNLTWGWVYTSTDGPDQSQIVTWNVGAGEGAFTLKPSFVMTITDVPPTVIITGPDTVATGVNIDFTLGDVVDPGQDEMIDCNLYWGDGTSDDCFSAVGGGILGHIYGTNYGNPTLTVVVTDEDGDHVAASKTLTVTGVTTSLQVDQSSVSGFESQVLTNTGTYSPLDASLSWSASEGTVIDEGDGVWSWSLPAGSAEGSRTVTINAGALNTDFTLTVTGDGVSSTVEDGGPNGGDGNYDGIPDSVQMNVASVASPLTGRYMSVAAAEGMTLTQVSLSSTPSTGNGSQPQKVKFPLGYLNFELAGMTPGGSTSVTLFMTNTTGIKNYYKYSTVGGWFRFNYANGTGAEILSDRIILYLKDGGRGDGDGLANGVVADPGGPSYELDEYLLTVNVSGGGAVSEATGIRPAGDVVTPTATADAGWTFSGWSGALTGISATQSFTMTQDKTVTALFTQDQYTLARQVVGGGSVAISPNQGSYVYDDVVAAIATADTGWTFSGWSGDLSGSTAGENVTMNSSKVITATFTQNQYTLNSGVTGNGSVVLSPDQGTYVYGDVVAVQAVPDPGYAFQSWSGDLSGSGSGQNLTMTGNKSATALFATASYTVGTSVVGSGSIVLDPDQATYAYGDVISVTAVPAADWHVVEWQVGLSGVSATQILTMTENIRLAALFELDTYSLNTSWVGGGSVSVNPEQSQFSVGQVVTLTAIPTPGYTFVGWSEEFTDTLFSSSMTTTLTMTESKSVLATFLPVVEPITVPLYSGWNLLGFSFANSQPVTAALSTIEGSYNAVYGWDGQNDAWTTFVPGFLGNNLADMVPGAGYWVNVTGDVTLTLTGTLAGGLEIPFYAGWNLYGYTWEESQFVTETLASIAGNYDAVYGWNGQTDAWTTYVPGFLGNNLWTMNLAEGFWVNATADVTVTQNNVMAASLTRPGPAQESGAVPPPALPALLYGRILDKNGQAMGPGRLPDLTVLAGRGEQSCASGPVQVDAEGEMGYWLTVSSEEAGCGPAGTILDVRIGGSDVLAQVEWRPGQVERLDLVLEELPARPVYPIFLPFTAHSPGKQSESSAAGQGATGVGAAGAQAAPKEAFYRTFFPITHRNGPQ